MSARALTKKDQKDPLPSIQVVAPWHARQVTGSPTPALQQAWRMIQNCDHTEAANVFRWRDWKLNGVSPRPFIVSRDCLAREVDAGAQILRSTQPFTSASAAWKLEA